MQMLVVFSRLRVGDNVIATLPIQYGRTTYEISPVNKSYEIQLKKTLDICEYMYSQQTCRIYIICRNTFFIEVILLCEELDAITCKLDLCC